MGISSRPVGQGRPTSISIFDVLGNGEYLAASEASLRESTYVAMTMLNFPLLSFVNEPISHLANPSVRPLVQIMSDTMQECYFVPENVDRAYGNISAYVTNAASIRSSSLSLPIQLEMLVPNDGDGVIELSVRPQQSDVLQNAIYHRLHAVDAPELFCTSFINANGNVDKRHNGHLSHLAVHYYFHSFSKPIGTSLICKENPRFGETPVDKYQRPLSSFWFAWLQKPNPTELILLDEILASIEGQEDCVRGRVVSSFNPRDAVTENPFFLSLNALLVLSRFCHVYTK